jgi:hypothetical protein
MTMMGDKAQAKHCAPPKPGCLQRPTDLGCARLPSPGSTLASSYWACLSPTVFHTSADTSRKNERSQVLFTQASGKEFVWWMDYHSMKDLCRHKRLNRLVDPLIAVQLAENMLTLPCIIVRLLRRLHAFASQLRPACEHEISTRYFLRRLRCNLHEGCFVAWYLQRIAMDNMTRLGRSHYVCFVDALCRLGELFLAKGEGERVKHMHCGS